MIFVPETSNRKDWSRLVANAIKSTANQLPGDSLVFVSQASDLPPSVSGVRTLRANTAYYFTTTVDLAGDRLVAGQNTVILGSSSENSRIKSTGLTSAALISSAWSMPMRGVTIEAAIALNLDATDNGIQALDWFGVNFTDCESIGLIKNFSNVIWTDNGILNSGGLIFDGTIGTIGLSSCIFDARPGSTAITIPATATITRRFRVIYSAFVALSGETALDVSTSATLPIEGYILDTCNFGGGGTYTSGVASSDILALWSNCRGIKNSDSVATMYMQGNATATDIITVATPIKIAGTTIAGANNQRFDHATNKLTYTGARTRDFFVSVTATLTAGGSNDEYGFYIAKNGVEINESEQYVTANTAGRVESVALQAIIELSTTDYVEVFMENITDNSDGTISFMNAIITPVT